MAKKAQKGKPAKKAVKPIKKAVAKRPAKKVAAKKIVAKPIKKTVTKKVARPVKKVVAKKIVKKVIAKKVAPKKVVAKKIVSKKVAKPVKKVAAKKAVAKKAVVKKVVAKKPTQTIKKVVTKKVIAKKASLKAIVKPLVKVIKKEVLKAAPKKIVTKNLAPTEKKTAPIVKQKLENKPTIEVDSTDELPMIVEYKTPSIRKPLGPTPVPHVNTDTRTRYNDSELKEFKELILKKLGDAQKDFELLKSTLSHKDDHGTDDTSPTFKLLEDGSDVLSKEETAHLAGRQEKFIQNLQNALIRIENKTYGICRASGKLIPKERLKSVPHATLAIEAKLDKSN